MDYSKRTLAALAIAGAALVGFTASAEAATTIKVDLWDKSGKMTMTSDMGYLMPRAVGKGMIPNPSAPMGIKLSTASVPAGDVTFSVTNDSGDLIHEMIVMPVKDPSKALPYNTANHEVNEDKAGDLGEVSELDPGGNGSLTLNLKPGEYMLYCNVPGHFASGMWATFKVK